MWLSFLWPIGLEEKERRRRTHRLTELKSLIRELESLDRDG